MNDNEIKLEPISKIASAYNIREEQMEMYGKYKAKIDYQKIKNNKTGKLILVTSTSPTKYGEGKTTLSIAISDGLNALEHKSIPVLREPSLGPVFGTKGGACGGGYSKIVPSVDINLHFTGDIHAITSANNLLCAIIDNHIFWGNELNIDSSTINFKRCLDINDRALRHINIEERKESFDISTASEIMAIVCLSKDMQDLKERLSKIFIAYSKDKKEIYAKDLKCVGALCALLKDTLKPNIVQTLEHNLAIVHGGPFANIAHGTASLIGIKTAMKLCDYTVVEAGFGSDMGGFKFFDIFARQSGIYPDIVLINTTIRSLKYNGEDSLKKGLCNLEYHVKNMQKFSDNIMVILNKFENDSEDDINTLKNYCNKLNILFSVSEAYQKGSQGVNDACQKILSLNKENKINLSYDLNLPLEDKIKNVCCSYYNAKDVMYSKEALLKLKQIQQSSFRKLPICIAKTPMSISDNKDLLGNPKDFIMKVSDLKINNGAGFIVVYMGNILTMPGLSKRSKYLDIDVVNNQIINLN